MIKQYRIEGLDCANCAAKLEKRLKHIELLKSVNINFFNKKLLIDVDEINLEKAYKEIIRITKKVEPDVTYSEISEDEHHNHNNHCHSESDSCSCGHNHTHHHKHNHGKDGHIHQGNNHPLSQNKKEEKVNERTIMIGRIIFSIFTFVIALIMGLVNKYAQIGFILISYLVISYDVIYNAFKKVVKGKVLDENFLMMIASIGALIIGEMLEAVAVMIFYQVGELCQNIAVDHSRRSISNLMDLKPEFARLKRIKGEKIERPNKVNIGEIIVVKPGEKIPLDGVIVKGNSSLDTSLITGESKPMDVYQGDSVSSGTINLTSVLEIEVTSLYKDSNVVKILNLVENASANKSRSENFITKFAKWYTPIVVMLALIISFTPYFFFDEGLIENIYKGLSFLVVSCPCALVISVPLAFFSGIGRASKQGILVKGGNYLETLAHVNKVVFDKTGTLTKGQFKVSEIDSLIDKEEFIKYAVALEKNFNHPIAKSIIEYYGREIDIDAINILDIPGYGVKGNINGKDICLGNAKLMSKEGINYPLLDKEGTILYLAIDNEYTGNIVISDCIKDTSIEAIKELKNIGIEETMILSGDNECSVKKVQKDLSIDRLQYSLTPKDKLDYLEKEIKKNKKGKKIVFVGDGVNDAPSLSLADVGIAMGGLGSDAAIESSDIVIMDDNPKKIVDAIKISKKTRSVVIQNIIFALLVKVVVMILVTFNLASMWIAIFADVGVALLAILNSIRLLKQKIK